MVNYVALSRAGMPHKTKVVIGGIEDIQGPFLNYEGKYTTNVVYTEVLWTWTFHCILSVK